MVKQQDQYLHTNCMSVLGNLSYKLQHLHPYVSDKLIKVIISLMKRNITLSKISETTDLDQLNYSESRIIKHVIHSFFNILAVTLAHNLFSHCELIYCLLHAKQGFLEFHWEGLQVETNLFF